MTNAEKWKKTIRKIGVTHLAFDIRINRPVHCNQMRDCRHCLFGTSKVYNCRDLAHWLVSEYKEEETPNDTAE